MENELKELAEFISEILKATSAEIEIKIDGDPSPSIKVTSPPRRGLFGRAKKCKQRKEK